MKKILIVGASSTSKSVYKFILDHNLFDVLGFVVDKEYKISDEYCGIPLFDFDSLPKSFNKEEDYIFVAIQWNRLNADRRDVYERLKSNGFKFANIISPNAVIHGNVLGDNCWICDNVVIENDVNINNNVFVKTKATIGHFSNIMEHSFIGAHSYLAGNVTVGKQTYIGISATIFNSVNIGEKCLIGGGVIVKRNIPNYSVVKLPNDINLIKQYNVEEIENKLLANIKIR